MQYSRIRILRRAPPRCWEAPAWHRFGQGTGSANCQCQTPPRRTQPGTMARPMFTETGAPSCTTDGPVTGAPGPRPAVLGPATTSRAQGGWMTMRPSACLPLTAGPPCRGAGISSRAYGEMKWPHLARKSRRSTAGASSSCSRSAPTASTATPTAPTSALPMTSTAANLAPSLAISSRVVRLPARLGIGWIRRAWSSGWLPGGLPCGAKFPVAGLRPGR